MNVRRGLAWSGSVVAAALLTGAAWVASPLPGDVRSPALSTGITITDREGVVLRTTRAADGSRVRWMPLGSIDPDIVAAFIAVEDRRFLSHHGIDWVGAVRAARDNLFEGRVVSGASTITMQLARLVRPGSRGWLGKARQAMWALRLEAHMSKEEILEQYLDRVEMGQGAIGVGSAAALYFDADAGELSLAQAALLAGIAHAPSRDNPFVSPARAAARREYALGRLRASGYGTPAEVAHARIEPLVALRRSAPFLAPHFTTRTLALLEDSAGPADGTIRTSLDLTLQGQIESEVRATVQSLHERGAEHAAAVVIDNASGAILAWVGSPDFWADTAGQTDMVISPRQPGSALKPFLYGLAFDRGSTPATVIADVARSYVTNTGPYRPRNYDHRYHGPVRAREALASSYNVPAVELADRLGPGALLRTLHAAGFSSLSHSAEYYGLGLALGDGDVTLLELANAYRALAGGGVWRPVRFAADGALPVAAPGRA